LRCKRCDLHKNATKQVKPRGSDDPLIYLIGEAPGREEDKSGLSFVGRAGQRLDKELNSLDILDQVRIFNPVRCIPLEMKDGKQSLRAPTFEEISACEHYLFKDIANTNPSVIMTLGNVPSRYILGEEFSQITKERGSVFEVDILDQTYLVVPTFHPSALIRKPKDDNMASQFSSDFRKALKIAEDLIAQSNAVLEGKTILKALDFKSFEEYYKKYFDNDSPHIVLDFETNDLFPYYESSEIIGFSLGMGDVGVYVVLKSLDYTMPPEDASKCHDLLFKIIKEKQLIVHNSKFERSYIRSVYDYEVPHNKMEDTLAMSRLLMGGRYGSDLKKQAMTNLSYPNWDKDVKFYLKNSEELSSRLMMARNSEMLKILEYYGFEFLYNNVIDLKSNDKFFELRTIVKSLYDLICKYYPEEDLRKKIFSLIPSVIKHCNKMDSVNLSYDYIPERILSKYGAIDSLATYDLFEDYSDRMLDESNDNIDLFKGYRIYLEHMYLGYLFEKNGAYWDEDMAADSEEGLLRESVYYLKQILSSELLRDYLINKFFNTYSPQVLLENYSGFLRSKGFGIVQDQYRNSPVLKLLDLESNKKMNIKYLSESVEIPDDIKEDVGLIVYELVMEEISNLSTSDELKPFFNPGSSTEEARNILEKCLVVKDIKLARFIDETISLINSKTFDSSDIPFEVSYLTSIRKMMGLLNQDDWDYSAIKYVFEEIKNQFDGSEIKSSPLIKAYKTAFKSKVFKSVDDEVILLIYKYYRMTGVNPDDEKTWDDRFKFLVNFRYYKKIVKLIDTFINGTPGRSSLKIVDKKSFHNGDDLVFREGNYNPDIFAGDNKSFCHDTNFGINTAITGRWTSSQHTLPSGSGTKKYFSSRFKGGTILQPDYSQMELRVLAYAAKEENMLEAFRRGEDIHTFNAQQIFKKEEVTKSERKFAKGASFSIIYGATVYNFAETYCNNDVEMARDVFKRFFQEFPEVKDYLYKCHNDMLKRGRVDLITNRYVNIPIIKNNVEAAKRHSQNYAIQGAASDIAGSVFFDICEYLKNHNYKSKPFLFIHDSYEIDVYPFELIDLINNLYKMMSDLPLSKYGVPCMGDMKLGKSLGHEITLKDFNHNKKMDACKMVLKGYKKDIEETVKNWKKVYSSVEIFKQSSDSEYISIDINFQPKQAYMSDAGRHRESGTAIVKIKY